MTLNQYIFAMKYSNVIRYLFIVHGIFSMSFYSEHELILVGLYV